MFLQEILLSHPFLMSRNWKRWIANGAESNRLNPFSRIRGTVVQGLGNLFITSICSHFFNKTILDMYFFTMWRVAMFIKEKHIKINHHTRLVL